MNRITIINDLIRKHGYKSYLEIGVKRGECFRDIVCEKKVSVDPVWPATFKGTSDEFFEQNADEFDIIFIDGLHENNQVRRDMASSLDCLSLGGTIVIHDCLPKSKAMQEFPRPEGQRDWTGNVWKAFVFFRRFAELEMFVYDCDMGVGVIRVGKQEPIIIENPTYKQFRENKQLWLNIRKSK